ncbi:apolipoprotein acyltransferase [Sedimentitalea arenosa]|jgi:hypothetical protein|uniref:Apolipoprotein acyltransferase n=1 Tax=Sedimentitalea arenosa TaxID=2798803 RepID=A0A8J7IK32_9RHOB|nr:apolipoprotein acyltransferase [Arenibacterium arenosum]MBJ6373172.1 apolipoprotein acyltransferase [Arenibacterium arenosum]
MIVIAGAVAGAAFGAMTAKKRGGNRADIAQYAVASAMAFAVVGMLLTVIIDRVAG